MTVKKKFPKPLKKIQQEVLLAFEDVITFKSRLTFSDVIDFENRAKEVVST